MNEIKAENIKPYTFLSDKYKPLLNDLFNKVKSGPYRPSVHIAPPSGLLNDPNGLCYFNDAYHVFYQWYPFGAKHDMKHWNHVSSKELTGFNEEKEILIPDKAYEKNGCYSGNALIDNDLCYLFYTANYKDKDGIKVPMQAYATMDKDGKITKSSKNPIIKGSPEGMGHSIRDPFVFKRDDTYYMLLGTETVEHKGALLLYESKNIEDWEYLGEIKVYLNGEILELGSFVECPGLIEVDGEEILFLSLMDSKIEETVLENRFVSLALMGKLDIKKLRFNAESLEIPDYGFDYYAPQPFTGKDDSPLLFSWFGCGDQALPEDRFGWRHSLTLPREIKIENNRLKTPLPEEVKSAFKTVEIKGQTAEYESTTEPVRLLWEIESQNPHTLKVGKEDDYYTVEVKPEEKLIEINRKNLKLKVDPDYGMTRSIPIDESGNLKLELFLDNSFNELYVNDGESVASFRSYEVTD